MLYGCEYFIYNGSRLGQSGVRQMDKECGVGAIPQLAGGKGRETKNDIVHYHCIVNKITYNIQKLIYNLYFLLAHSMTGDVSAHSPTSYYQDPLGTCASWEAELVGVYFGDQGEKVKVTWSRGQSDKRSQ